MNKSHYSYQLRCLLALSLSNLTIRTAIVKDNLQKLMLDDAQEDGWQHGGPVWGYFSYNPKLNLLYYGTNLVVKTV